MNKLSPLSFKIASATHLEGTNMSELFIAVNLEIDEEGFIKEHVFENLKMTLRVASKMTPDNNCKVKFQNMLNFMEGYYKQS
jgi:hypothetical protein